MRRATGRVAKLCAEASDNKRGVIEQTVSRTNREMSVEQNDNDRRDSRVFIDLGKPDFACGKANGPGEDGC
jgi:hypothetical protein